MFWSGNYIAVRELNSLLKEENVTLSQVLEADDILQECKADNKALIQFLTKPEILADLITLITEEPPKNVELSTQYRYASIACEVLTSHLSMLSDRLSLDAAQMNRLCDFLNRDPPLNPLLASYFSKTVEMLLEKSPKQDWCLHHIVCLRVLDFFKSRRDFLPNLLRHMATSAIADVFKYLMRVDDLIKTVMEWLEEHQFLECLIQIICGTYVPEVFPVTSTAPASAPREGKPEVAEKAELETSEKPDSNHTEEKDSGGEDAGGDKGLCKADGGGRSGDETAHSNATDQPHTQSDTADDGEHEKAEEAVEAEGAAAAAALAAERMSAAASANAAALLCDLIVNGCRARTGWGAGAGAAAGRGAVAALQAEAGVRALLAGMFTSPPRARRAALVNGVHVLLALLHQDPAAGIVEKCSIAEEALRTYLPAGREGREGREGGEGGERGSVELGVAPHLPLLHQALLHEPAPGAVGLARLQVAALLARLALSEVEEVASTMLTLGTPGVLLDMFFKYSLNNFLHAHVYALIKHALANRAYRTQYARHLLIECDLLTRLMDVFEENKSNREAGLRARAAHMGHVVLALGALAPAELLAPALALPGRWPAFRDDELRPLLQAHDTPLGGYYPSENFYEVEIMPDPLAANYDFNDMGAAGIEELTDGLSAGDVAEMCGAAGSVVDSPDFIADGLGLDDDDKRTSAKNRFLEIAGFDADMWEEAGEAGEGGEGGEDEDALYVPSDVARELLDQHSPWEAAESEGCGGEGWAHFGAAPPDPFAPPAPAAPAEPATPPADEHFADFTPFWSYDTQPHDSNSSTELESNLRNMRLDDELTDKRMDEASSVELANNLLTAMSAMSADAIANIVNANLPSPPAPRTTSATPAASAPAPDTPTPAAAPHTPGGTDTPSSEHR